MRPGFSSCRTLGSAAACRAMMSRVPSVDPPSAMIISMREYDCRRSRQSTSSSPDASSRTGTTTETSGGLADGASPPAALSVIIVTWNSAHELGNCLDSLEQDPDAPSLDIVCVDNRSEDDSISIARAHGAFVLGLDRNLGFPAAVNRALAEVATPYVLLLNPDVEVAPGTLRTCLEQLVSNADV